ncbi:hypothetical protein BV898_05349 [Hypsibius exemplaris]|uniref:Uncharacterized protein n=1 Tax=Hypsibius exemplaris TaxID=2072580 RepID=A0A1W0X0C7_HYPEX|nr:hypothetical protein BV898_05349 [Hypsibius exemplaris]
MERKVSLASLIKANLTRLDGFLTVQQPTKRGPPKPSTSKVQKAVMQKMNDGNISGAVRVLKSDDAITPATPETLHSLRSTQPLPILALTTLPLPATLIQSQQQLLRRKC